MCHPYSWKDDNFMRPTSTWWKHPGNRLSYFSVRNDFDCLQLVHMQEQGIRETHFDESRANVCYAFVQCMQI